ncbi:hypothetical protein PybrP1_011615, partial [[Pythium] brassicae (nom. inval.)]
HGAEHAQRRERERVRRVAEHHERERRVAEDRPPLGDERPARRQLVLEQRGTVVRGHLNAARVLRPLVMAPVVRHDVELRRHDQETREDEHDHERAFDEKRRAPAERRRRERRAVHRAARLWRVRVDKGRGVALKRRLADTREHASEQQHVIALRVLGDAAHDDGEDPHGHAEGDRAERPVHRVARDERRREDAQVERLLRRVHVQRVGNKVLEALRRARDDAAVDVIEQVDGAEQHDDALRAELRQPAA